MTDSVTIPALPPVSEVVTCACGGRIPFEPVSPQTQGELAPLLVRRCPACGTPQVVQDPNIGRVLLGLWRLERRLGLGGMGMVYLAKDVRAGREVAVKFLHPQLVAQREFRERFMREGMMLAKVEHPNLVRLHHAELEGDLPFLMMSLARGRLLSKLLKERGAMSLAEVLPIARQLVSALSALHARGLVHRDVKPANIMVADDGHVTLLDFGLARTNETKMTQAGTSLGSPQYSSPEQVVQGALDGRSDAYSLAIVLVELLVGHRLFSDGPTGELFNQQLHLVPDPPHLLNPAVPLAVSNVLMRAIAKPREERFDSVADLLRALEQAASGGATEPRRRVATATTQDTLAPVPLGEPGPVPTTRNDRLVVPSMTAPRVEPEEAVTSTDASPIPMHTAGESGRGWPWIVLGALLACGLFFLALRASGS